MIDRKEFIDTFCLSDKELVVDLIDIFLSGYEERFREIRKNVAEKDFEKLRFNAHKLKGGIAIFQDTISTDLSKKLTEMAKNRIDAGLDQAFADLEKSTILLLEEMNIIKQEFTS